ncbi:hypothetical protein N7478_008354 [Penicillium angulare]|uniref:uncharacterized protein n=1 Tax=Penicillium angulare TaxID=116970 RepID=UPI0025421250|nr:uncharacterized protein N7478_008354 [Penicillium angulare]KAJ5273229.1 hypothetical protein N7478_008354 [Penicillium angulare]
MPRIVRRRPLAERIQAYLNPWDFLLWVSEEIDGHDWEQMEKDWGLAIGAGLNFVFLVARANSRSSGSKAIDDVFGEDEGVPWLSWLAAVITHSLLLFSAVNAIYTFFRKKRYRMFEAPIDKTLATPSAHRVRVDSSPMSSSPFRYLANAISTESAQSRAHPDAHRDVWEVAMWDPLPMSIRLLCLFSPGHVLIYWLFLPTQISDPRPSVTIVTTVFLTTLLSVQMSLMSTSYAQQAKDSTLVHKEVLKEYDTKFVHPRTRPLMRDVGTQFSEEDDAKSSADAQNRVEVYTPTFIINRGFKTSPNPNYVSHVDPDGLSPRRPTGPATPSATSIFQSQPSLRTPVVSRDGSPMVRTGNNSMRQPQFRPASTTTGDGGSLGVYTHSNSPLRKSASTAFERRVQNNGDFIYTQRAASPTKPSPLKRSSLAPAPMSPATGMGVHRAGSLNRRETGRF